MLRINEKSTNTIDDSRMTSQIKKFSRNYYLVNRDLIESDIDRLDELYNEVKDKEVQKEIEEGIVYLLDLLDVLSPGGYLQTIWKVKDKCLVSVPFKFRDYPRIGVYTHMYLERYDDFTLQVDLSNIKNAIAIQMCHRDMFYNTIELDRALTEMGIGIKGIDNVECLFDITLDDAYNEGIKMKVNDNPYTSLNNTKLVCRDYFGKVIDTEYYKDLLDSSINKASVLVLDSILNKLRNIVGYETYFIGGMGDKLYFSSNMDNFTIQDVFLEPVSIRVLGRSFDVTPTIKKVQ